MITKTFFCFVIIFFSLSIRLASAADLKNDQVEGALKSLKQASALIDKAVDELEAETFQVYETKFDKWFYDYQSPSTEEKSAFKAECAEGNVTSNYWAGSTIKEMVKVNLSSSLQVGSKSSRDCRMKYEKCELTSNSISFSYHETSISGGSYVLSCKGTGTILGRVKRK